MIRSLLLIVLCLMATTPQGAIAEDEALVGDRPDFTESAATIDMGHVQVEAGFTLSNAEGMSATELGEVLVRIGLASNTEIRMGLGSWVRFDTEPDDIDGLTDFELGLKQRLIRGSDSAPEVAVIAALSLPTGADGIGADEMQPTVLAAADWPISDSAGLGTNLGWSHAYDVAAGERFANVWISAAFGVTWTDRLGMFIEGYGFNQEHHNGDTTGYADFGFTYAVNADLQFDARVGRGFNGLDEDWFAGFGVVLRK